MYYRNEPGALFHDLHHAHRRRVAEEQSRRGAGGLNSPMVLLTLWGAEQRGETWSQREVARQMRLSPATVAVSLKTMEREGYVTRRADARDARRNQVELTPKGRETVAQCGQAFRAVDRQMLEGFSPQEREQLGDFFRRMLENLGGAEPPPFAPPHGREEM